MVTQDKQYVVVANGKTFRFSTEDWDANKDEFMTDFPDADIAEVDKYNVEDSQDGDYISVLAGGKQYGFNKADWDANQEDFLADFPDAQMYRVRPVDYHYNQALATEAALEENAKRKEAWAATRKEGKSGASLADIYMLEAGLTPVGIMGQTDLEEAQAYIAEGKAIDEERAALQEQYDNNPRVKAAREAWEKENKGNNVSLKEQIEQQYRQFRNENFDYVGKPNFGHTMSDDQMMADLARSTGNLVRGKDQGGQVEYDQQDALYRQALINVQEAEKARDYSSDDSFFAKLAKGQTDVYGSPDFWSRGIQEMASLNQGGNVAIEKFNKLVKNFGENLTEKEIDLNLSPAEKAYILSLTERTIAEAEKAAESDKDGFFNAYDASRISAEMVGYMADFLVGGELTGGAKAAMSKAISKWLVKNVTSKMAKGAVKTATKAVGSTISKTLASAASGILRVPVTGGAYGMMGDQRTTLKEDGSFRGAGESVLRGAALAASEYFSEEMGGVVEDVLGVPFKLGKSGWNAAFKNVDFGKIGQITNKIGGVAGKITNNDFTKLLRDQFGLNSIGEIGEEYINAFVTDITGLEPGALKELSDTGNLITMSVGMAPFMMLGGAVSMGQYINASNQVKHKAQALKDILLSKGYSEEQAAYLTDFTRATSAHKLNAELNPILKRLAVSSGVGENFGTTDVYKAVAEYANAVANYQVLGGTYEAQEAQQRDAKRAELEEKYQGRFYGEDGMVRMHNLADGKTVLQLSDFAENGEAAAIDFKTGEHLTFTEADINDRIDNEGNVLGKESLVESLDSYLSGEVMALRTTWEQARMQRERQEQIDALSQSLPESINIGTEGQPKMLAIKGHNAQGVTVVDEDGNEGTMTWESIALKLGKPIKVLTDAQIAEAEAKGIAMRANERRAARATTDAQISDAQSNIDNTNAEIEELIPNPEEEYRDPNTGEIDQDAFWEHNPEGWADYNDRVTNDGGIDTMEQIESGLAKLNKQKAELDKMAIDSPNARKAVKAKRVELQEKIDRLTALQQKYNEMFAAAEQEAIPEEERVAENTIAMRERVNQWREKFGLTPEQLTVFESEDEIWDENARRQVRNGKTEGWYSTRANRAFVYFPGIDSMEELDKTIAHEVVTHYGLHNLMGEKAYNELMDKVWNLMSDAARNAYYNYPGVASMQDADKRRRAAAEEFVASIAENVSLDQATAEQKSIWQRIVEFFRNLFKDMDANFSEKDIADIVRRNYQQLADQTAQESVDEFKAEAQDQAQENIISEEVEETAPVETITNIADAAQQDPDAIDLSDGNMYSTKTEDYLASRIREYASSKEGKKAGWNKDNIEEIIEETQDLITAIHNASTGNEFYDEFAAKDPTFRLDWRDGQTKPIVTWTRANIEYKYDMSADLLCVNNEGLEEVLSSEQMVELMRLFNPSKLDEVTTKDLKGKEHTQKIEIGFSQDDYLELYNTLKDLGFVVPCKGCFDAAGRFKMLPSVAHKFAAAVNAVIDERNADPEAFDNTLKSKAKKNATIGGLPSAASTKLDAIRAGVAGDNLTEHIKWTQLMSADGQTKMLSDWGGIFRAWQRTGAGRPKDKLLPEPYYGDIVSQQTTIIGKYGEKTPSFKDILVNTGTGLRRNSHSEFRPVLAVDEIQFMRDAFIKNLTVFKYMKELDDVRLFGKMGVKFNMSFFPEYVPGTKAAGLDLDGNYIPSEESVGAREFPYIGEDGKRHYDGKKGWQEAQKHINKDVSLSSVILSIPHLIKALTDVPTTSDKSGIWGSLIPFHSSGATSASLYLQGLGRARANGAGHGFEEALTRYGEGVTNFEAVQNDRFGKGWVIVEGKKAGEAVEDGHKLEFANGNHYYNKEMGLHLFASMYIQDSELPEGALNEDGTINLSDKEKKAIGHSYEIDYNNKVREIGTPTAYKEAADFYLEFLPKIGLKPRFDFEVPEDIFLQMCADANVDPSHPKLGWKGTGNSWSPIDSEAYYSLFCDYGMTDPATGEWAPHNPVGYIDENGERVFRMPDNTVEIIKEGLDRYSNIRKSESAKIDEAIKEFARRSVEKGRISQEAVESVLGKGTNMFKTRITPEQDAAYLKAVEAGDMETAQRMVDEAAEAAGYTIRGDHGRVSKFSIFDRNKANPEGDWGQGFYFSNNEEDVENNYATVDGPDLEAKIEREVERRVNLAEMNEEFNEDGEVDEFAIREAVEDEFITSEPNVVHAAIKMDNPFVVGHGMVEIGEDGLGHYDMQETYLTVEYETDEDGDFDYSVDPTGTLVDLVEALNEELSEYEWVNINAYDILSNNIDGMTAGQFEKDARELLSSHIDSLVNENGEIMSSEIIRAAIERAGFDGIVDNTVNQKFGTARRYGRAMDGMDGDTRHYIAFQSSQIKETDPVTYDNDGNVIPLSERFNEEKEDIRFKTANNNQAIFVSNAAKAVEGIKMEKATPEQWLKMIEKNGGLKAGEDKWMGLSDWLNASDKKTLTKAEVLNFINENMIVIEEQHYGNREKAFDDKYPNWRKAFSIQRSSEGIFTTVWNVPTAIRLYNQHNKEKINIDEYGGITHEEYDKIKQFADEIAVEYFGTDEVWQIHNTRLTYTTDGLKNKHEIALTVPTIESWNEADDVHFGDAGEGRAVAWIRFGETTTGLESDGMRRRSRQLADELERKYGSMWNSDEIYEQMSVEDKAKRDEADRLYHLSDVDAEWIENKRQFADRLAERGYTESAERERREADEVERLWDEYRSASSRKKVLVIDEIQSKRHQDGREKGYLDPTVDPDKIEENYDLIEEKSLEFYRYLFEKYGEGYSDESLSAEDRTAKEKIDKEFKAAADEYAKYFSPEIGEQMLVPPDAPFDKNWHELAMKRMLRYAAENGYDVIAWTKGDQQAYRYDIGGVVESIYYAGSFKDGIKDIDINLNTRRGGIIHLQVDNDGKVINEYDNSGDVENSPYIGKNLSEILGKELANKVLSLEEEQEISGEGLRVGGEGMKGFYDKMLPAFMNKYGKKWGVKVEDIELPNLEEAGRIMHSVPVTEEMKASVMEGQVMFKTSAANNKSPEFSLPNELFLDDPIMFKVSRNNRQTISSWLNKRPDLNDEAKAEVLDYLDQFNDATLQLAVGKWYAQNAIKLPEDIEKCMQAVASAKKAKIDALKFASPMEIINEYGVIEPKAKPINPDKVSTLSKVRDLSNGISIYDVEDSEESRKNMREIINTHYGKNCSPWCILQGDENGKLTAKSQEYWRHYNGYPKQVAFKDGKLLAFSANDSEETAWWDRMDKSYSGVPVNQKIGNDKLGRTRTVEFDQETGKETKVHDIKKVVSKDGIRREWTWRSEKEDDIVRYGMFNEDAEMVEGFDRGSWNLPDFLVGLVPKNQIRFITTDDGRQMQFNYFGGLINYQSDQISIVNDITNVGITGVWTNGNQYKFRRNGKLLEFSDVNLNSYEGKDAAPFQEQANEVWKQVQDIRKNAKSIANEMLDSMEYDPIMFSTKAPYESAKAFAQGVVNEFNAKYKRTVPTAVVYANSRPMVAEGLGIPVDELTDELFKGIRQEAKTAGGFNALVEKLNEDGSTTSEERILIFAKESHNKSAMIDGALFHENIHGMVRSNPELLDLGKWLFENREGMRVKIAKVVEAAYPEEKHHEEMLTGYMGYMMSVGRAQDVLDMLPEEYKPLANYIYEEFGYIPEQEDSRRSDEYRRDNARLNAERDAIQQAQDQHQGEQGRNERGDNGEDVNLFKTEITPEVRSEMNTISAQAIVNGTYLKAPNGKDTNLTPEQWALVRTKNFKRWFGDWMKPQRIEKLRRSKPVVVNGDEYVGNYELNKKSAQKYIIDHLRGQYTNADTGDKIHVSNIGAQKVTSHGYNEPIHLASVMYIPRMIEEAIFITEEPNTKRKNEFETYRYYVCGLKIGGEDYTAKLVVGVSGKETYYDHDLSSIEKGKLIESRGLVPTRRTNEESTLSEVKDKRLISILKEDFSKVIDENGEPMVMHHGSAWEPLMEPKGKAVFRMNDGLLGKGAYFSNVLAEATLYAEIATGLDTTEEGNYELLQDKYVTDYFLNVRNEEDIYREGDDMVVVAKSPNQIKSATDNTGEFSESDEDIRFKTRTKPAPTKTQEVYKLMRLGADGKLYPLFIGSAEPIELGTWYDAESPNLGDLTKLASGVHLVNNETGEAMTLDEFKAQHPEINIKGKRPNVAAINWATENGARWIEIEDKSTAQRRYEGESRSYYNLGINGSGQVGQFAMRPGWHAGSLPSMRQIGKGKDKNLRDDSFVWVKGRIPADVDYQSEADANPDKDIPTHIPTDGFYMKATNANAKASQADKMGWYVAGSFVADEIISDAEARSVIDSWNAEHPDAKVEYDYPRESGREFDPARGGLVESEDIMFKTDHLDTAALPVDELVAKGKMKSAYENLVAGSEFMKRIRAINGNLDQLRRAASAQREYDQNTVQIITSLANDMLEGGKMSDMTNYEVKRLLGAINSATGKSDLTRSINRLMDVMIANQLRHGRDNIYNFIRIRGKKVDSRGVEVRGRLDIPGQQVMDAFRENISLSLPEIEEAIANAEDRLTSDSETIARNAEHELIGLAFAKQYVENIKMSENEEKALRKDVRDAEAEYKAGARDAKSYRDFAKVTEEAIRENRTQRVLAYQQLVDDLAKMVSGSVQGAKLLREGEKARVEQIQHYANSDLKGEAANTHKQVNNGFVNNALVQTLTSPLSTFEQWLRVFGKKSAEGKGYLYNHFMGEWNDATNKEYLGMKEANAILDAKAREVFGDIVKRWSDIFSIEKKLPTHTIQMWDDGEMKDYELTQGNLLYIYMVNKMIDGKMKLRKMGVSESDVDAIVRALDPRFVEIADWVQDEFLPSLRDKYNAVHERLFGAPMAAIDNYFPIKVNANARVRDVDLGVQESSARPSTITGSIIKRTKNSLALDVLGSNAFDVVLEHVQQMEHWAAFAEFNRDLNTLLSYRKFRNRVQNMTTIMGSGKEAWNNFRESAEIAAGVYQPKTAKADKLVTNAVKGLTAGKINFRLWTAMKQILSMPAFLPYTSVDTIVKGLITPWNSWNWAMENLPAFEKRWRSRQAGNVRLKMTEADWKLWQSEAMEFVSRIGMTPNAFVDAVTCSVGSKAVYDTQYARYRKDGYTHEKADKKAKLDATVAFNATQQSSEAAFLSAIQSDRTFIAHVLTVFRNNSFGMQRELNDALRNMKKRMTKGFKEESIEFMTKQMVRDGLTEEQAKRAAERIYRRSTTKDAARIAVFGFLMQFIWALGGSAPYLLFGDDDDEKKEMLKDAAIRGAFGSIEGLGFGNVVADGMTMAITGELDKFNPSFSPAMADIANLWNKFEYDWVAGMNDLVNICAQAGLGVNPQILTDIVVAIVDACDGDMTLAKEVGVAAMRILQMPQSQIDNLKTDEIDFATDKGLEVTIHEFAKEYAEYKKMRGAGAAGLLYSDEREKEIEEKYIKRFLKHAEELKRSRGNEEAKKYYEYLDTEYKEVTGTLNELKRKAKEEGMKGNTIGSMEFAKMLDDYMKTETFNRYVEFGGKAGAIERLRDKIMKVDPKTRETIEEAMLDLRREMVEEMEKASN